MTNEIFHFHGPKLKIKRANKHIFDLNKLLTEFVASDFYRVSTEFNPNTGKHGIKVELKPMSDETALFVGDAIHNLRSALDFMVCEIVGITDNREIKFPFCGKRSELEGTVNKGPIQAAGSIICDLIINTIKPYRGGNDLLYALHDLDIIDKHRLLLPVISVLSISNVRAKDDHGGIFHFDVIMDDRGPHGGYGFPITGPYKITIENHGNPAFNIGLSNGPLGGEPLIPTLHQLSQLVSGIVQAVEKAYLTRCKTIN
jgi:hypothetical protein